MAKTDAEKVCVAVLDKDGGYIGKEDVAPEKAKDRVEIPRETDLPTDGSYRWQDGRFQHWKEAHAPSRPPSTTEYVLFELLSQMQRDGKTLSPRSAQWLAWYSASPQRRLVESRHPTIKEA